MKKKLYMECRCLDNELSNELLNIIKTYERDSVEVSCLKKTTAEQIDKIEEFGNLVEKLSDDPKLSYQLKKQLVNSIETPKACKNLHYIKRYIESCTCPETTHVNWKDGFHPFTNLKLLLED